MVESGSTLGFLLLLVLFLIPLGIIIWMGVVVVVTAVLTELADEYDIDLLQFIRDEINRRKEKE